MAKRILFICTTANTAAMLHEVAKQLPECVCNFTALYSTHRMVKYVKSKGLLVDTPLDGRYKARTEDYFIKNNLHIDNEGQQGNYDLVVTSQDLIWPGNTKNIPVVQVQEGMTDPFNFYSRFVWWCGLPGWWALSTAVNGCSNFYDKFCVASEGYKEHFIKLGVKKEKLIVTGLPNYDNLKKYFCNNFPHKDYVLAATTDMRETYRYENRKVSIRRFLEIANGRQLIFKLHPNEKHERAIKEIKKYAPDALVYTDGNPNEMIANAAVLITQYSTLAYVGLALGKETYSYFDIEELKRKMPIQNDGQSAQTIAEICQKYL